MPDLKFETVDEQEQDYIIRVTRPDGVSIDILVPKSNNKYANELIQSEKDSNPDNPFGLNLLSSGDHYP